MTVDCRHSYVADSRAGPLLGMADGMASNKGNFGPADV